MSPVIIFTLVLIVFNGADASSYTREYKTLELCQAAEDAAHEAAKNAIGVTDVGTSCLQSTFDPRVKPGA